MAILLAIHLVVGLDDGADTAKLVFEFVDAFWGDSAIKGIDLFA